MIAMQTETDAQKATRIITEAQEHRIALVKDRTARIREEEARTEWDVDYLEHLYKLRLSHITECIQLGVDLDTLMAITRG